MDARLSDWVPAALIAELEAQAARQGVHARTLLVEALEDYLHGKEGI
jgi:hypothetical protein